MDSAPQPHDSASVTAGVLIEMGFSPIPIPFKSKIPNVPGWQRLRLTRETLGEHFNGVPQNVGALNGEASSGQHSIDLDIREAERLAARFLPATDRIHGRPSAPASKYWYRPDRPLPTKKYRDPTVPEDDQRSMIVERLGGGSQTVMPGSVHPTGERYAWLCQGEAAAVDATDLARGVAWLAAASLLVRHWPKKGARHDAYLALAGGLLRAGWTPTTVEQFVDAIAWATDDEEAQARLRDVVSTATRLETDQPATGWPTLATLVDKRVVARVQEWLDLPRANLAKLPISDQVGQVGKVGQLGQVTQGRTCLANVTRERVRWVWPDYIPLGKITDVTGDPGLGKSGLLLDIAARVTRAAPMPDGSTGDLGAPGGVVILSAEDDLGDTIRPRLEAAGADLSRIIAREWVEELDDRGEMIQTVVSIPRHVAVLRADLEAVRAKLLIIDPPEAYLDGKADSWKNQQVRQALEPVRQLAAELGVAVVMVRHLNKNSKESKALYRGGGSIAFAALARSALVVAPDPADPDGLDRILAPVKTNLGKAPSALRYRLEACDGTIRVEWRGACEQSADVLLAPAETADDRSELGQATRFLEAELAERAVPSAEVFKAAKAAGIAEKTLRRAGTRLKVKYERVVPEGDGPPYWTWRLPDAPAPPAEDVLVPSKPAPIQVKSNLANLANVVNLAKFPRDRQLGQVTPAAVLDADVGRFLTACTQRGGRETFAILQRAYGVWCFNEGVTPIGREALLADLRGRGLTITQSQTTDHLLVDGLALRSGVVS
jgi:hypothetical protein